MKEGSFSSLSFYDGLSLKRLNDGDNYMTSTCPNFPLQRKERMSVSEEVAKSEVQTRIITLLS